MTDRYFILQGREAVPVSDLHEWAARFGALDRQVASEFVGDAHVSTVFLGINHAFGGGAPLIFESMVFGGRLDGEQRRYSTWQEAEAGHAELVEIVRSGLN